MALGFGALGEVALGELAQDPGFTANVPAPGTITVAGSVPAIAAGASIGVLAALIVLTAAAPGIQAGVNLAVPAAPITLTASAPQVLQSANIAVSAAATITVTASVPAIAGGSSVGVPAAAFTVTATAPAVAAGKLQDVPAATITLTASAPQVLHSANLAVPAAPITLAAQAPAVGAGVAVVVDTLRSYVLSFGGLGAGALGEFPLGDGGEDETVTSRGPPIIRMAPVAPAVQAGKLELVPVATIALAGITPEIDARRRKLKVLTIAS